MNDEIVKRNGSWEMRVEGFKLSRTGLEAIGNPTYQQWEALGETLKEVEGAVHWWIGDWVNYGEKHYGETYAQAVEETPFTQGTIQNDAWVARSVETSRRREVLSFAHHQEVAPLPPQAQEDLLDRAEEEGWTRNQMRANVRRYRLEEAATLALPAVDISAPKYKTGDIVELAGHILICNDNTSQQVKDFLNERGKAALVFCDPPYNADVAAWDCGFNWQQDYLIDLADVVAVTPGIGNIPGFMRETSMPYKWSTSTYISNGMTRGALGFGNWIYTALFSNDNVYRNSQDVYTVSISSADADDLGAKRQKPPMYLSWLFDLLTGEGETIIDAFGGSGTSVIVAHQLKRRCICIEKDPHTFSEMVARIEQNILPPALQEAA